MASERGPRLSVLSGIEPNLAGVCDVFPAGVVTIWCLVSLPNDETDGQLALEFKAMADEWAWNTRIEGPVETWRGRSDGRYCAGAGNRPAWPPGRYRWRALVDDRLIGETFCTVASAD